MVINTEFFPVDYLIIELLPIEINFSLQFIMLITTHSFTLICNFVGDDGAMALARCLQTCNQLTTLNGIGDGGALCLGNCLKDCSCLHTLRLNNNLIAGACTHAARLNMTCFPRYTIFSSYGYCICRIAISIIICGAMFAGAE